MIESKIVLPFLKWAGGKRWLVKNHPEFFPETSGIHIEPFAGSAAVFFALRPKKGLLSDSNGRLIECFKAIKKNYADFENNLKWFASNHSKEFYYETRNRHFDCETWRAAQFLYLNRVCFNGIYRENLRGEFNVPIGSKTNVLLDSDDFGGASKMLKRTSLMNSDFEKIIDRAAENDFLFIDPPYTTKHNLNGFVKYNQKIFSWSDQERLAAAVHRAHKRNVTITLSNADHADVRELYQEFLQVISVRRANVIASKSEHRGETSEMVATNV